MLHGALELYLELELLLTVVKICAVCSKHYQLMLPANSDLRSSSVKSVREVSDTEMCFNVLRLHYFD